MLMEKSLCVAAYSSIFYVLWMSVQKYKIRLDGLRNHVIWIGCRWLKIRFLLSSEGDLKQIKKLIQYILH